MTGREANRDAWTWYVTAFPDYVIYPDRLVHRGDDVLVLGSTTGSHLGLSDQDERQLKVIWRATVRDGLLALWQIIEDTPAQRALLGLGLRPAATRRRWRRWRRRCRGGSARPPLAGCGRSLGVPSEQRL